jgi:hypothetical protein
MDKDYLLQEIIEGIKAVQPFPQALKITKKKEKLMHILEEVEMELEHVISCLIALKDKIR